MKIIIKLIIVLLLSNYGNSTAHIKISPLSISNNSAKQIQNYWTAERIKSAIPVKTPEISQQDLEKLLMYQQNREGEIMTIEPTLSNRLSDAERGPEKANVNAFPFSAGGKLFFTKSDGKDYVCSAQFVGSTRVLMTAAHCLMDQKTGQFFTNISFKRAYNNGGGQLVRYECASVWPDWKTGSSNYNWKKDYGFLYTATSSEGGALGLKTKIPYSQWLAIGYPANYGNNQYMNKVSGSKGVIADGTVEMKNNPMRSGNSGGAWIGDVKSFTDDGNYAIGLNSFHAENYPDSEFGPYFDADTFALYEYVRDKKCNN